jgi:hypothetical protein
MEIIDTAATVLKYIVPGIAGLVGILVVVAMLFGKRVDMEDNICIIL